MYKLDFFLARKIKIIEIRGFQIFREKSSDIRKFQVFLKTSFLKIEFTHSRPKFYADSEFEVENQGLKQNKLSKPRFTVQKQSKPVKNCLKGLRLEIRAEKSKKWLRHLFPQVFSHKTIFYLVIYKIARLKQRINPCVGSGVSSFRHLLNPPTMLA